MKKLLVVLIMLSTLIIAGALYGTHTPIIEEHGVITLTQAYQAQYPQTIPDVVFDPLVMPIPF